MKPLYRAPKAFVRAVDGVWDDPDNHVYWMFFLNGEEIEEPPHRCVMPPGSELEMALIQWIVND